MRTRPRGREIKKLPRTNSTTVTWKVEAPFRLLHQLASFASAWWRRDRIRCSPNDGRLLRLTPGSALLVRGKPAVVLRRRVGQTIESAYVAYECDTVTGSCELRVEPIGVSPRARILWRDGAVTMDLGEEDVSAFPAARSRVGGYNGRRDG